MDCLLLSWREGEDMLTLGDMTTEALLFSLLSTGGALLVYD